MVPPGHSAMSWMARRAMASIQMPAAGEAGPRCGFAIMPRGGGGTVPRNTGSDLRDFRRCPLGSWHKLNGIRLKMETGEAATARIASTTRDSAAETDRQEPPHSSRKKRGNNTRRPFFRTGPGRPAAPKATVAIPRPPRRAGQRITPPPSAIQRRHFGAAHPNCAQTQVSRRFRSAFPLFGVGPHLDGTVAQQH